jgi:hypothetical protein
MQQIFILNAKSEIESDPENFSARITKFGVVLAKI